VKLLQFSFSINLHISYWSLPDTYILKKSYTFSYVYNNVYSTGEGTLLDSWWTRSPFPVKKIYQLASQCLITRQLVGWRIDFRNIMPRVMYPEKYAGDASHNKTVRLKNNFWHENTTNLNYLHPPECPHVRHMFIIMKIM